jgi:UTP--glucose-1-phosphate uridylyltransferase
MKAIIPAAGLGTRMLPVTKSVPKELLPVEGKPAIQWVIEEAARAGLGELVVVISPEKNILRNYLTPLPNNHPLKQHTGLAELEQLLRAVEVDFVEQPEPRGLGDAILRCRKLVAGEPFALLLPDNVFDARSPLLRQMLEAHKSHGKSCAALWRAEGHHLRDGAVVAERLRDTMYEIRRVLPKGVSSDMATDLRPAGRSILDPEAFDYLEQAQSAGELDDVAALDGLARAGKLIGIIFTERFYHLGAARPVASQSDRESLIHEAPVG